MSSVGEEIEQMGTSEGDVMMMSENGGKTIGADTNLENDQNKVGDNGPVVNDSDCGKSKGKADQKNCGKCSVDFSKQGRWDNDVECSFCGIWFCTHCTHLKRCHNEVLKREDVFFACEACEEKVKNFIKSTKEGKMSSNLDENPAMNEKVCDDTTNRVGVLERKFDLFASKLDEMIDIQKRQNSKMDEIKPSEVSSKVSAEVSSKISEVVTNTVNSWSKIVGDNPTAIVTSSPEETQGLITKTSCNLAREIKREEKRFESRSNNIMVYHAPEENIGNFKARQDKDKALVSKLLAANEIDDEPVQIVRLGKSSVTEHQKSENNRKFVGRPIKLVFRSNETVTSVLENARKLANAEDDLRSLSIDYDRTIEEHAELKKMLKIAREKDSKNPNLIHKVRGPPWNMRIVQFNKRTNPIPEQVVS